MTLLTNMKQPRKFSFRARLKSFGYALEGLIVLIKTQHNARIQFLCGIIVLIAGWWLSVGKIKFLFLIIAIAIVWFAEAMNTVFEILTSMISVRYSVKAKRAKDIAAAAVLIASLMAAMIGFMILGPPLLLKFFP